jgi:4-aminobutyrate aminotransferase
MGLGRTGNMFACQHYGVTPDILVLGKGLGGGIIPLAAVLCRGAMNVAPHTALGHYTHEKNPVACAAGLATLQVIEEEGLVEHARALGACTMDHLREMAQRHPLIGDIRGLGLILGLELLKDRSTLAPATDEAERVMYAALRGGLNFKVTMGNILTLTPALTLTQAEMNQALAILERAIEWVETREA